MARRQTNNQILDAMLANPDTIPWERMPDMLLIMFKSLAKNMLEADMRADPNRDRVQKLYDLLCIEVKRRETQPK